MALGTLFASTALLIFAGYTYVWIIAAAIVIFSLGEMLSQGKANIQAPWLGLCGFFTVAIMLSLLIFIGEAVRDAFDPRKTFR